MYALQIDNQGAISFSRVPGRSGELTMRHFAEPDPLRQLAVGDEKLKKAAEVVLGRLDIAQLLGSRVLRAKAEQVCRDQL